MFAEKPVPDSTSEPNSTGNFVFPTQDAATPSQMFVPVSRVLVPVSTARPHTSLLYDRVMTKSTTPQTTSLHQTAAQTTARQPTFLVLLKNNATTPQQTAPQKTVLLVNNVTTTPQQTAQLKTALMVNNAAATAQKASGGTHRIYTGNLTPLGCRLPSRHSMKTDHPGPLSHCHSGFQFPSLTSTISGEFFCVYYLESNDPFQVQGINNEAQKVFW